MISETPKLSIFQLRHRQGQRVTRPAVSLRGGSKTGPGRRRKSSLQLTENLYQSPLSNKPPPSNKPPLFRGRKLISPLPHSPSIKHPLPTPNYSSLINERLDRSITTVKLRVDRSGMVNYLPTGSSDLIMILGCMT